MVLIDYYFSHLFCNTDMGKHNNKTSFIQRYEYLKFVDLQQFPRQQVFLLVILHYCHWWIQAGWILQQAHQNLYDTWIINIRDLAMKPWSQVTFFYFFVGNRVKNQDLILVLFLSRIANNFSLKGHKGCCIPAHVQLSHQFSTTNHVAGLYQWRITIRCGTCRYTDGCLIFRTTLFC